MSDYIKKEDAIKSIKPMVGIWADDGRFYVDYQRVLDIINNEPSADVEPVRHGRWSIIEYEYFTCSECGYDFWNGCDCTAEAKEKLTNGVYPNYCPNCGAKMDGKEQENETNRP